ncbi:MAG: ATP synthase subunit I [Thermodesulfobacteriota bacterium]
MLDQMFSLQRLQVLSWVCLAVLVVGSWLIMGMNFALSVLAGGVIANLSFLSAQRDVAEFMDTLDKAPPETEENNKVKKKPSIGKSKYMIKFWLRLAIIGLVLLILIKSGRTNVFGLILGLSTVVFTITLSSVSAAGHYFFSRRR